MKIDKTAPALTVDGVEGGEHGDSASITPVFTATDAASGVASVTGAIGGLQVKSGEALPLWKLPLGENTLTVTAKDKAGHITEKSVTFTVTTSFDDVEALLTAFRSAGTVAGDTGNVLGAQLDQAVKEAGKGKKDDAIKALERFAGFAGDAKRVTDKAASDALIRDAQALIEQLRG
ncbi:FIMAH domain-containing protein [Microbispora maris]|uniref:FIMAH domain-containing protein n=1 Tax=Microbispora maris TaxID=3144104 RepID=UPI003D15E913